ncbi:MAG TPA: hypothetical protein PLO65_07380 [Caulobacter sp.]|nr:hypothetical protein [Caulobacter sp.]
MTRNRIRTTNPCKLPGVPYRRSEGSSDGYPTQTLRITPFAV